ncbi:MAG: PorT family protein [Prevotellaceae bacterium]|jgi:hypothetical protein|nr:PorT family protein [Prevotellaceae bacterium]
MKRIIVIIASSLIALTSSLKAQDTIHIKNVSSLEAVNDSLRSLVRILESKDTIIGTPVRIHLEQETAPKPQTTEKRTLVQVPGGGEMIIFTDEKGEVRKTIYKNTRNSKKRRPYYFDTYIDLGANRTANSKLFQASSPQNPTGWPNLVGNTSMSFAFYGMSGVRMNFISFETGMGFEWFNFRFSNGMTLKNVSGMTTAIDARDILPEGVSVSKSKLTVSYLSFPIMIKFSGKRRSRWMNNSFFVSMGVNLGINLGHHTKVVHSGGKFKDFEELNIAPLRYGFTARIGFGSVGIFGQYYMTPLFSTGKGPQVYPYVTGVSLTF